MIIILVRIMKTERARESGQISHKARFLDLSAFSCTFSVVATRKPGSGTLSASGLHETKKCVSCDGEYFDEM